jgi:hypothetical protein
MKYNHKTGREEFEKEDWCEAQTTFCGAARNCPDSKIKEKLQSISGKDYPERIEELKANVVLAETSKYSMFLGGK